MVLEKIGREKTIFDFHEELTTIKYDENIPPYIFAKKVNFLIRKCQLGNCNVPALIIQSSSNYRLVKDAFQLHYGAYGLKEVLDGISRIIAYIYMNQVTQGEFSSPVITICQYCDTKGHTAKNCPKTNILWKLYGSWF